MIPFQKVDFINPILFVIIKDLDVLVFQQIEINLVPVVANAHDKSSFQIKGFDLLMQGQLAEFFPTHEFYFSTKT